MKKFFAALSGLTLVYIMTVVFANNVMSDLQENIIRFHVIANSDSQADQEIKLKIRDAVLNSEISVSDEKTSIENLYKIEQIANNVLSENNFGYGAAACYGFFDFPEKSYGKISLTSGKYKSIRIVLGNGLGKTWWRILSPPACLMDGTVKFDENALKAKLSKTTYAVISEDIKYDFKIIELLKKVFWFNTWKYHSFMLK